MDFNVFDDSRIRVQLPTEESIAEMTEDDKKLLVSRHQAVLLNQRLSSLELRSTEREARLLCDRLVAQEHVDSLNRRFTELIGIVNRLTQCARYAFCCGVRVGREEANDDKDAESSLLWEGSGPAARLGVLYRELRDVEGIVVRTPDGEDQPKVSVEESEKKAEDA